MIRRTPRPADPKAALAERSSGGDGSGTEFPAPGPRRRRGWLVAAAGAVVAIAAAVVVTSPGAEEPEARTAPRTETDVVARGDLVEQIRATGKLEYRNVRDLGSSLPGTVSGLPDRGTVVARGDELFRVDDTPVLLMLGPLPMWRDFAEGMSDGADVRQLEKNLTALGFFDEEPDDAFDWTTIVAVRAWQDDLGLEETGTIEQGRVVFATDEVRVQDAVARIGDRAGGAILTVSDTTKEAVVDIDPDMAATAPVDGKVDIELPDGTTAKGTITKVGAPVERENSTGGTSLKIPVTLVVDDAEAVAGYDTVNVSVDLLDVVAEDVLLVPVTALLAQPGGKAAVEHIVDGESEMRPVELGRFADGMVEVVGGELTEGDVVAVAQ